MQLLTDAISLLRKPFPQEEDWRLRLRTSALVGVFITFFLYFFKPFDLTNSEQSIWWLCVGFGLMTFLTSALFDFVVYTLGLRTYGPSFTFWKWIVYMVGVIFCISLANFVYVRLTLFGEIRWEFFHYMLSSTFLVGIFPVVGLGAYTLLRQEKKYAKIAAGIAPAHRDPADEESTQTDKKIFGVPASNIRYVEALQNYVKIGYINADGSTIEITERSTLKEVMQLAEGTSLAKSHRSYLVNKAAIESATGNAQGLVLTLTDCTKQIPVSRSMVPHFRS